MSLARSVCTDNGFQFPLIKFQAFSRCIGKLLGKLYYGCCSVCTVTLIPGINNRPCRITFVSIYILYYYSLRLLGHNASQIYPSTHDQFCKKLVIPVSHAIASTVVATRCVIILACVRSSRRCCRWPILLRRRYKIYFNSRDSTNFDGR